MKTIKGWAGLCGWYQSLSKSQQAEIKRDGLLKIDDAVQQLRKNKIPMPTDAEIRRAHMDNLGICECGDPGCPGPEVNRHYGG